MNITALAAQARPLLHSVNLDIDMPYPNIYWCTVRHSDHGEFHTYIAGEFTEAAKQKLQRWCREHHGFMPHRANSKVLMRRLKLMDLIECPDAFTAAYANAAVNNESDIIAALDKLPDWIAKTCGLSSVSQTASESLWERMTSELERYSQRA